LRLLFESRPRFLLRGCGFCNVSHHPISSSLASRPYSIKGSSATDTAVRSTLNLGPEELLRAASMAKRQRQMISPCFRCACVRGGHQEAPGPLEVFVIRLHERVAEPGRIQVSRGLNTRHNVGIQRAPKAIRWNDQLCRPPLFAGHGQQGLRVSARNGEQSTRGATRLLATLLPSLKRAHGHAKQSGEL